MKIFCEKIFLFLLVLIVMKRRTGVLCFITETFLTVDIFWIKRITNLKFYTLFCNLAHIGQFHIFNIYKYVLSNL